MGRVMCFWSGANKIAMRYICKGTRASKSRAHSKGDSTQQARATKKAVEEKGTRTRGELVANEPWWLMCPFLCVCNDLRVALHGRKRHRAHRSDVTHTHKRDIESRTHVRYYDCSNYFHANSCLLLTQSCHLFAYIYLACLDLDSRRRRDNLWQQAPTTLCPPVCALI